MKKKYHTLLYLIGCSVMWGVNTQKAGANSFRPMKIAQFNNPDSSGITGEIEGDIEKLKQEQLIDPLIIPEPFPSPREYIPSPGSTIGVPSAYGASWGDAYIGGAAAITDDGQEDAAIALGFGIGNPRKSVGLEIGFGLADVTEGDDSLIGFKIHRSLGRSTSIAAGWANAIRFFEGDNDPAETVYGSISQRFELNPSNENNQLPLTMTLGVGTGAYRSTGSLDAGENVPNVFASAGLRVIPRLSLISSWTGSQLNLGTSIVPFNAPLSINLAATDVTDNRDGASRTGLLVSSGYVFQF